MTYAVSNVLDAAKDPIQNAIATVSKLSESASKLPYYKYNQMWNRQIQDLVYGLLFWGWLGGYQQQGGEIKNGRLLTIEELGGLLKVPVNLKDEDAFHLTIEEYLHALISLVEELVIRPPLNTSAQIHPLADKKHSPVLRATLSHSVTMSDRCSSTSLSKTFWPGFKS
jgi:hypothetical protein